MQTRKSLSNTARAPSHPFRRTTRTRPPAYVGRAESQQPSRGRRRAERHGERLAEGGANFRPSATQRTALGMVRLVRAWVDSTFRDRARRDPHLAILHEDLPATRRRALRHRGHASRADSRERGHSHVGVTCGPDRLGRDAARRRLASRRLTASPGAGSPGVSSTTRTGAWSESSSLTATKRSVLAPSGIASPEWQSGTAVWSVGGVSWCPVF